MPDLSDLSLQNLLNLSIRGVLTGGLPVAFEALVLLKNFVRIVDQSVRSYELARAAFGSFVAGSGGQGFGHLFQAQGHMENCITSLDRAVRHVARIRRRKEFAGAVPILTVLKKPVPHEVSELRNAIEHAEERVLTGKIKRSDTMMLWMDEDAVEIEGKRLSYARLSTWLVELHKLSFELTISRYSE